MSQVAGEIGIGAAARAADRQCGQSEPITTGSVSLLSNAELISAQRANSARYAQVRPVRDMVAMQHCATLAREIAAEMQRRMGVR